MCDSHAHMTSLPPPHPVLPAVHFPDGFEVWSEKSYLPRSMPPYQPPLPGSPTRPPRAIMMLHSTLCSAAGPGPAFTHTHSLLPAHLHRNRHEAIGDHKRVHQLSEVLTQRAWGVCPAGVEGQHCGPGPHLIHKLLHQGNLKGRQGRAGWGRAGQGRAGWAGQGRAGQGRVWQGRAGQRVGQAEAGQGRAGQAEAGQGRDGQGRAGQGSLGGRAGKLEPFTITIIIKRRSGKNPTEPKRSGASRRHRCKHVVHMKPTCRPRMHEAYM